MTTNEATPGLPSLKGLTTFSVVAQAGSLTRAASAIGIAPSAVSRRLTEAERAFGGALFHRTGRGMEPTELALELLPRVDALLEQARALANASRDLGGVPRGPVTLGLVGGVLGFVAPAIYAAVLQRHPEIRLRVIEGYSGEMEAALSLGRIDMAVLNRYTVGGAGSHRKLFESQLCAVGRPDAMASHLGLRRAAHGRPGVLPDTMPVEALIRMPLVLPTAPNALRTLLDEHAQRLRARVRVAIECVSSLGIKAMMREHDCVAVLPDHAVADELAAGTLVAIPLAERAFRQSVVLATSSQRPFTLASKAVARLLPKVVEDARRAAGRLAQSALMPAARISRP